MGDKDATNTATNESNVDLVIPLDRDPQLGFGFSIVGGELIRDTGYYTPVFISRIKPDSPAAQSLLAVGNRVTTINGFAVENVSHEQVVEQLKASEDHMVLKARETTVDWTSASIGAQGYLPARNSLAQLPQLQLPVAYERVEILFPFTGGKDDELKVVAGDVIHVTGRGEDGWCVGECQRTKEIGFFPGNFAKKLRPLPEVIESLYADIETYAKLPKPADDIYEDIEEIQEQRAKKAGYANLEGKPKEADYANLESGQLSKDLPEYAVPIDKSKRAKQDEEDSNYSVPDGRAVDSLYAAVEKPDKRRQTNMVQPPIKSNGSPVKSEEPRNDTDGGSVAAAVRRFTARQNSLIPPVKVISMVERRDSAPEPPVVLQQTEEPGMLYASVARTRMDSEAIYAKISSKAVVSRPSSGGDLYATVDKMKSMQEAPAIPERRYNPDKLQPPTIDVGFDDDNYDSPSEWKMTSDMGEREAVKESDYDYLRNQSSNAAIMAIEESEYELLKSQKQPDSPPKLPAPRKDSVKLDPKIVAKRAKEQAKLEKKKAQAELKERKRVEKQRLKEEKKAKKAAKSKQ